ncbi:MAG TPA: glycosyltransferase [Phycisphaerales bacterium]|nr:glycosyltransferase [Phycisphaerales bacterium]HIB01473.1 glycosyltransferase [Phycisphaerales bacterium]HIB50573.1 glycosyltransferase [Phycisphaerales bacterium]HIN84136.1 glycosyltransferase [Phycisphaerales bacterium]HIO52201.1 glycosyltransferase [Phycisphaerales bacterium]
MKLSFVIPAWNEEELIGETIASIQRSASKFEYEIVVADDASDDNTAEISKQLGAVVVSCNNRQIGLTRNDGAKVATGSILIFVDADTLVSEDVINETVEAIENGVIAGGSFPTFEGDIKIVARILTPVIRTAFYILRLAAGAYLFCTVESFKKSGGFDPKFFAAEEVHLVKKLHKLGKFKTLKTRVVTSGRKFRTHSSMEILSTLILVSIPGIRKIKKRKNLWYGPRKKEQD